MNSAGLILPHLAYKDLQTNPVILTCLTQPVSHSRHFSPGETHARKQGQGTWRRKASAQGMARLVCSWHVIQMGFHTCIPGRHLAQNRQSMPAHCSGANKGSFYDLSLITREIKVINIETASWYMSQFKVNSLYAFPLPAPPQTTMVGVGRRS